jgi:hypothetical protein
MLDSLADEFLVLAQQLNLFAPVPHLRLLDPIPPSMVPSLHSLTLGKNKGSDMDVALRRIESGQQHPFEKFAAILLSQNKKDIIGWTLIGMMDRPEELKYFTLDIFVDPRFRRSNYGSLLRYKGIVYGESKGYVYKDTNHFTPYKEKHLSPQERKKSNLRQIQLANLAELEEQILDSRQKLVLYKKLIEEGKPTPLTIKQLENGLTYFRQEAKTLREQLGISSPVPREQLTLIP